MKIYLYGEKHNKPNTQNIKSVWHLSGNNGNTHRRDSQTNKQSVSLCSSVWTKSFWLFLYTATWQNWSTTPMQPVLGGNTVDSFMCYLAGGAGEECRSRAMLLQRAMLVSALRVHVDIKGRGVCLCVCVRGGGG